MVEPRPMDRGERLLIERAHVDAVNLRAEHGARTTHAHRRVIRCATGVAQTRTFATTGRAT